MILPNGTLVAVLDGTSMRLFHNRGHEPHIELVPLDAPDLGAANAGSGTRHHSSTANPDNSRLHEDNFAAAAAAYLNGEALAGRIDHAVVIADPRTLGELRKHFRDALSAKLVGELPRNLVKHTTAEIETSLISA